MHNYQQLLKTPDDYYLLLDKINRLKYDEKIETIRYLARTDLFFLLWMLLGRKDIFHPWLFNRCREVQNNPDNHLDLWARGHYKSTIITFAKTIQDILATHGDNPTDNSYGDEPSFGIFSHTRPIAKAFLAQIKREFEQNEILKECFCDIIWENPYRDSPKWSEDDGLILKRQTNRKEATIEAWGVVDGQPTSKHFNIMIYDDITTHESVRSPLMMEKTLDSFRMSLNLGATDKKIRMIGTRYHMNDLYKYVMDEAICNSRIYPATINGMADGEPVFFTREKLEEKRRQMGVYIFSTQMLQNPISDDKNVFLREWLRFYQSYNPEILNKYIIVDAANEKKKTSDYTAMVVIGLGADLNYYLLDVIRDRLSLVERKKALFNLHRIHKPIAVGYEKYGIQVDITYMKECMDRETYHFDILELGGNMPKKDRISRLLPIYQAHRFYLPEEINRVNYEAKSQNLVDIFLREEYDSFPLSVHDDVFDAMARILDDDLHAEFPRETTTAAVNAIKQYYYTGERYGQGVRL